MKKLSLEFFQELGKERGFKLLSDIYINSHEKMDWQCPNNHVFKSSGNAIKQGRGCPECFFKSLKHESHEDLSIEDLSIEQIKKVIDKRKQEYKDQDLNTLAFINKFSDIIHKLWKIGYRDVKIIDILNVNAPNFNRWKFLTKTNKVFETTRKNNVEKTIEILKRESGILAGTEIAKKYNLNVTYIHQTAKKYNISLKKNITTSLTNSELIKKYRQNKKMMTIALLNEEYEILENKAKELNLSKTKMIKLLIKNIKMM